MFALTKLPSAADNICPPGTKISPTTVPMRWPLRYQILFPFAGLFLAVIVIITAINAVLAVRASAKRTENQLREVTRTLLASSFPLTDAVLRQTRGLSGAEFVVAAADGSILASSFKVVRVRSDAAPIINWEQLNLRTVERVGDENYFHTAIALAKRADRAEPGLLHIFYPERTWREARWNAIYPPLVVGLFSLMGVSALAFAIAGRLSKPIQSLQSQVSRLADGDFQTVTLPTQNDELRDLVASVNKLAEQLDEMRKAIKRSERLTLVGQLSGGLAHHLRNDVTGARMAIQLHAREYPAEEQESLNVALRQLALAEQHLQQFLAAGQPRPLNRRPCELGTVINELVSLVGPTCKHHRVDLTTELVGDISQRTVDADPEQLRQALLNLVLNAIEACGPDGWVRVECDAQFGNIVCLRVLDSGPGVTSIVADHLFEPFTTSKSEGVGLGLTVARQIIEAHGGTLHYSRDRATCFEISLPIRERATATNATAPSSESRVPSFT